MKQGLEHLEWAQLDAGTTFRGVVQAFDFLDPNACQELRADMDRGLAEPAEVFDAGIRADSDARRASNIEIDPAAILAIGAHLDATRDTIASLSGLSLADREGSSFLRYVPGGFYRRHRDRAMDSSWPEAARRAVSVVVFLNSSRARPADEEFSGGELLLYPESSRLRRAAASPLDDARGVLRQSRRTAQQALRIVPRRGSLVAFPSTMLHEVLPVRAGTRDVIVDWFYESETTEVTSQRGLRFT